MLELREFLRVQGVPVEAISLMEEQKVSEKEICVGLVSAVCKNKEKSMDMKDVKCRHGLASSTFVS